MTSLNISNNQLGWVSVPKDWETRAQPEGSTRAGEQIFKGPRGNWTFDPPPGATPDMSGVAALADAISANGALTSLNVSNNSLGQYWDAGKQEYISDMTGVEALAAAIPKCK